MISKWVVKMTSMIRSGLSRGKHQLTMAVSNITMVVESITEWDSNMQGADLPSSLEGGLEYLSGREGGSGVRPQKNLCIYIT